MINGPDTLRKSNTQDEQKVNRGIVFKTAANSKGGMIADNEKVQSYGYIRLKDCVGQLDDFRSQKEKWKPLSNAPSTKALKS